MKLYQRLTSFVLALGLLCGLLPSALAAEAVAPTPPEWMPEEHYLIFPGDEVYQSENWEKVLAMREDARNGGTLPEEGKDWAEGSAGMCYETALVRLKYAENAPDESGAKKAFYSACRAFSAAESAWHKQNGKEDDSLYHQLLLWDKRCSVLFSRTYSTYLGHTVSDSLDYLNLTMDDFFDAPYIDRLTAEDRTFVEGEVSKYRNRIIINLDGGQILSTYRSKEMVHVAIKDGRVMIPLRFLAERLGAVVEWVQEKQQIIMTRVNVKVVMTVGETTATVDGTPVVMDVAPYVVEGSTLIPARYLAEFFGQVVEWDNGERTVRVTEDKSVAGNSNLEAWALPMGAMLSKMGGGAPSYFGIYRRGGSDDSTGKKRLSSEVCRDMLSGSWGVDNREELISTVLSMTYYGHNVNFLSDVEYIKGLSTAEYTAYLNSTGVDAYMFPCTKALGEKWDERGILCWDLFRMSNLVQWGYTSGYITYAEALALLEPAVTLLKENFVSWDEAYENYLDGYNWWARNDVNGQNIWKTERGLRYTYMKADKNVASIFNDALFVQEIIPVPSMTAQQLLDEITD